MKRLLYYLTVFSIISCGGGINDSDIFNGEISTINDTVTTITVFEPQHEVILDGITYGLMTVYDSLMIFYNNKLPDMFYSIFNLNTGKHIGDFCPRGHGPGTVIVVSPLFHFYKENGELKTLLSASDNLKLVIWNISKSIENNKTVWDFTPYDRRRDAIVHNRYFRLNDKEYLGHVQVHCTNDDCTESTVPYYEKKSIYLDTLIKEYRPYKQSVKNTYSDRLLMSHDCIKPDGSKVAQFMCYLWQINMIDIETGKVTGYRPKEKFPDFSYLSNFSAPRAILPGFVRVTSNDKYIFAVYRHERSNEDEAVNYVVYVFDWDCNMIKKIKLKSKFYDSLFVDEVNNMLYILYIHEDGETIHRYDLKSVGL
jgi:hypothetical protein